MPAVNSIPSTARWSRSNLPLLVEALSRSCGGTLTGSALEAPDTDSDLGEWVEAACAQFGLDGELQRGQSNELASSMTDACPTLLALPSGEFAGLVEVRGRKARLITTDLRTIDVSHYLPVTMGWQIRVRPGSNFRQQMIQAGVQR